MLFVKLKNKNKNNCQIVGWSLAPWPAHKVGAILFRLSGTLQLRPQSKVQQVTEWRVSTSQ